LWWRRRCWNGRGIDGSLQLIIMHVMIITTTDGLLPC
jgi:hypothetical protein